MLEKAVSFQLSILFFFCLKQFSNFLDGHYLTIS
jgi:hypothetical protein